ncbi:MAG: cytochrome c oxidase subunit 3 [Acidobacteriota bacterium]|nr:cytochrome c oxidase subunit 3 [Acidobacteriota bacterium]
MPDVLAEHEPLVTEIVALKPGGPDGGGPRDLDPGGRGGGDDDDGEGHGAGQDSVAGVGLFAIKVVLVSITALFITIAVVYFARSRSRFNWHPVDAPSFLWLSTALMLTSSWSLGNARRSFRRMRIDSYARWLLVTFCLGLAFIVSQLLALRQLLGAGIYLRYNPHSSLFYVVTGAHALHLLGGMAALFYLLIRASMAMQDVRLELGRQRTLVRVSTLYWHFLDGLWIVLFALLLIWK